MSATEHTQESHKEHTKESHKEQKADKRFRLVRHNKPEKEREESKGTEEVHSGKKEEVKERETDVTPLPLGTSKDPDVSAS